jgi:hypothetical protein
MGEIVEVGRSYQDLGVYAALAVLSFVVVYLYRRVEWLHRELRNIQQTTLHEASMHIRESTIVLKALNDSLLSTRNERSSGRFSVTAAPPPWEQRVAEPNIRRCKVATEKAL